MANEAAPHGEWQRLYERYHAMSDEELLELASEIDDLTEVAADVLRREMQQRKLEFEKPADAAFAKLPVAEPTLEEVDGGVVLTIFRDTLEASHVCACFEEQGIPFEMRDRSRLGSVSGFYAGQPVAMALVVNKSDRERGLVALDQAMSPFRRREAEGTEELIDDGTVSIVGDFARREDAEKFGRILDGARMWHRIVANPEGSVEDENLFALEVLEIDLMRAGELVEKAMDLPEA
jgi:hypothetical protein